MSNLSEVYWHFVHIEYHENRLVYVTLMPVFEVGIDRSKRRIETSHSLIVHFTVAKHVAHMVEMRYKYKILVGNLSEKRQFRILSHRWQDDINTGLRGKGYDVVG
jgi:hypothetical protein